MRRAAGPAQLVGAGAIIGVVTATSIWSLTPLYGLHPAVAIGYSLIDIGFTLTALLLTTQPGQGRNSWLAALIAASSLTSHFLTRDIGILAPPAFVFGALTQVLAGMLILRYPRARFDRWSRVWARLNLPLAALFGVALLVTSRPEWVNAAPTRWWPALPNRSVSDHIAFGRSVWRVLVAASFLLLLAGRWRRLPHLERRTLAPIMVAAVLGATVIAADLVQWWLPSAVTTGLITARSYTGAVVAMAFAASALQLRLVRAGLTDLVSALSEAGPATTIRDALRRTLHDDSLEVFYWVPETSSFVDHSGTPRPAATGEPRMSLPVSDSAGRPLALIEADESLTRHRDLIDSALVISRLALENTRLHAGLRAQLAELGDARSRLLRSAFAQRRQLERDLHDGAQQRLLALAMRLAVLEAASTDDQSRTTIGAAKQDLEQALAELRQLAHGIYPAVLTQGGLSVALEAVADRLPIAIHLQVPDSRWSPDVEGVAYFVTCEALTNAVKHSAADRAEVTVEDRPGELYLTVSDNGRGWSPAARPDLPELADRVGALGGRLAVHSQPGRTLVTAALPLPDNPAPVLTAHVGE